MAILELRSDLSKMIGNKNASVCLMNFTWASLIDQRDGSVGGERRRVEIARALCSAPKFMLLDEPFAGVDPISVADIQDIIKHLAERGIGVLITDHNVRETLGICHRGYIVNAGRVLAEGPPASLLTDQNVRNVYLGEQFTMTLPQ